MAQEVNVSSGEKSKPGQAGEKEPPPLQETRNPAVMKLLGEAQDLQSRHRYYDALSKLDEAAKLDDKDPNIPNIRGAIYLVPAVREFDKAEEEFRKALALQPDALAPKFNLAELLFVKHEFGKAEAAFAVLLTEFPKLMQQVRHLIVYKVLVSQAEQKQFDKAEKTLKDNFTFMDDTPAYYFSKAAIAFASGKEAEAKDWIEKATGIFKAAENSAYLDALMEVRHIPNIMLPPPQPK